jgi:hypothetical protein
MREGRGAGGRPFGTTSRTCRVADHREPADAPTQHHIYISALARVGAASFAGFAKGARPWCLAPAKIFAVVRFRPLAAPMSKIFARRQKRTQYPRFRRFEPALMINLVDLWRTTSIRLIFASPDSICPLEDPAFARWFPPLLPMPPWPPLPPQTILAPRSARYTPASTNAVPASRCRDGFSPRKADARMITRTGCR